MCHRHESFEFPKIRFCGMYLRPSRSSSITGSRALRRGGRPWFATRVDERLKYIASTEWLKADLAGDRRRRLGAPLDDTRPMLRKPLAFAPSTRELRAKRRTARRLNKGKRPAPDPITRAC